MTSPQSQRDLFSRYIEICNQALEKNKERFPFKQILGAMQAEQEFKNIEVCIVDDQPQAAYVIFMDDNKISGQGRESCADCQCDGRWRVTKSYLEDVINNPEEYIKNPAKIDWEWVQEAQLKGA